MFCIQPQLFGVKASTIFFKRCAACDVGSPGLKWEDFNVPKVDVNDLRRPSTQWQGRNHKTSRHGGFFEALDFVPLFLIKLKRSL